MSDDPETAVTEHDLEASSDAPADDGATADDTDADATADTAAPSMGIIEARQRAVSVAGELLGDEPESVIRAERTDDGWRVLVEIVERSAVPDTQDVLGRYELVLEGEQVVEYGLTERYKRGDSRDEL